MAIRSGRPKCGMTRVHGPGESVPLTVVRCLPSRHQLKNPDRTATAVQLKGNSARSWCQGRGRPFRQRRNGRPKAGSGRVPPRRRRRRPTSRRHQGDLFKVGQVVDVTGTTIGKGLRRHDEAPQLQGGTTRPTVSRSRTVPRLDRPAPDAGPRVWEQAHVPATWASCAATGEPQRSSRSTSAQPAADPRRRPRRRGGQTVVRPSVRPRARPRRSSRPRRRAAPPKGPPAESRTR